MSRSRFGGFRVGKSRLFNDWLNRRSNSSSAEAPTSIQDFSYTDAQGIWSLRSTMQFPKLGGAGGGGYTVGLSDSLLTVSGQNDAWTQQTVDISSYAGATVRLVFKYTNGSGTAYLGDLQLDNINLDGNTYSFENTGHSFQTSSAGETTYASASWSTVAVATTGLKWNSDTGGTPSTGTGRTDAASGTYYVYAESSSPATSGSIFWLRSPEIVLSGSPTLSFYEARLGTNIGNLDVYLDVIS